MTYTAAVITVSDKGARGERKDTSGPAVCSILTEAGYEVIHTAIIPDEKAVIEEELIRCADELGCALVITTGGTGFAQRDITPEATLAVVTRLTPGFPELMRAESMKVTPHGCLSRGAAGIRGETLIINLPGSEKAAKENLGFILKPLKHGLDMLMTSGSADCAAPANKGEKERTGVSLPVCSENGPSVDEWLREAKKDPDAPKVGMYLTHTGVVRASAKAAVRNGEKDLPPVVGLYFDYDAEKVEAAVREAKTREGIYFVRVWLNRGELKTGDIIMKVMIGADIRPHAVDAFQKLVGEIKTNCVTEREIY